MYSSFCVTSITLVSQNFINKGKFIQNRKLAKQGIWGKLNHTYLSLVANKLSIYCHETREKGGGEKTVQVSATFFLFFVDTVWLSRNGKPFNSKVCSRWSFCCVNTTLRHHSCSVVWFVLLFISVHTFVCVFYFQESLLWFLSIALKTLWAYFPGRTGSPFGNSWSSYGSRWSYFPCIAHPACTDCCVMWTLTCVRVISVCVMLHSLHRTSRVMFLWVLQLWYNNVSKCFNEGSPAVSYSHS